MGNKWDEMRAAYLEAKDQFQAADSLADGMAYMLRGRLRRVGQSTLSDLKRELRRFNIHTGEWKP